MLKISLLLALFSVFSIHAANNVDDNDTKIIYTCKSGADIPTGYVIIAEVALNECRTSSLVDNGKNTWAIKKPGEDETVCNISPIPNDYLITGQVKLKECPGGDPLIVNKNAKTISRVKSEKK